MSSTDASSEASSFASGNDYLSEYGEMSGTEADISGFNDIYAWVDDPVADAWWGVDGTILRKHERERDHYDETLKRLHETTELNEW